MPKVNKEINISTLPQKVTGTKEMGEIVRTHRLSMGLTQKECAGLCNVGTRFLSDLENGKPTVEFNKILMVLKTLGLELVINQKGWTS